VQLQIVESISRETIRQVLAHNELKPWLNKQWCIPPKSNLARAPNSNARWRPGRPNAMGKRSASTGALPRLMHISSSSILDALTRSLPQKYIFQESFSSTGSAEEPKFGMVSVPLRPPSLG
jgi:hypothetical protein